jgi:uncharacterized damage-inducible protein DinB
MADRIEVAALLAQFSGSLLDGAARSIEDFSEDEVHFQVHPGTNSAGFEVWHIARTADNLIHFAFEREQPVWLQQGLNDAWGLPKADQGTGMDPDEAHGLRFPAGDALAAYCRDVAAAIRPKIEAMSDEYLQSTITIKPQGEMPRYMVIAQVIINHGNNHLGQVNLARTMQGKDGLGF